MKPTTHSLKSRMDILENARFTRHRRMLMINCLQPGWSVGAGATALGIFGKINPKWRKHHAVEGVSGSIERSSRPHRSPTRLAGYVEAEFKALRCQGLTAGDLGWPPLIPAAGHPLRTRAARRAGRIDLNKLAASTASVIASPAIATATATGASTGMASARNTSTSRAQRKTAPPFHQQPRRAQTSRSSWKASSPTMDRPISWTLAAAIDLWSFAIIEPGPTRQRPLARPSG